MSDLETRLRADLAEVAEAIGVDEPSAWSAIWALATTDRPDSASLVPSAARRRPERRVWVAVAAVALVGLAAVLLALRNGEDGHEPVPASVAPSTSMGAIETTADDGLGLDGRMAIVPTAATDRTHSVMPSTLTWTERREHHLLARPDGSAWVRVDLDPTSATWDEAVAKIGSGVDEIRLGELRALQFQEFTTWVVMWQQDTVTMTLRSGGLDMAAVLDLASALARGETPDGWVATDQVAEWNTLSITDQFGVATVVRSAEQSNGLDPLLAAIDAAPTGSTLQPTDVQGAAAWHVDPVGTTARDLPEVVWARDGMIVAVSRQDATVDDLRSLAATVTTERLDDVDVPVAGLEGSGLSTAALPRDVAILEQAEAGGGRRYQWLAFSGRIQTGPDSVVDGWCVSYRDSLLGGFPQALCGPQQGTFAGVAQTVAGTAVGVVASDVTSAWFVVNGVRVDATLAPLGELRVIRANVPVGERVALHLVRDGEEVAGTAALDATLMCVGCPTPVVAPPDWVMPTLTPGGVVLATTASTTSTP